MNGKILEAVNLSHTFADGTSLPCGLSLTVYEKDFLVLAGKNGSGKSVLVRHFNGLLKPSGGRVLFRGMDVNKNLMLVRQKVGMVFQNPDSQIIGQTLWEDTAFGPENLKLSPEEVNRRTSAALEHVDLFHLRDHRPFTLSGGEKRRLAIAGILAMEPEVLIFDEPFAGLDYPGVVMVLSQIVGLHKKGHTIVIITHEVDKCLAHANRLVLLSEGRITAEGTPEEVFPILAEAGIRTAPYTMKQISRMTWLR